MSSAQEIIRKGVADQTPGSKSSIVSMSITVVVPDRNNIRAPFSQERA